MIVVIGAALGLLMTAVLLWMWDSIDKRRQRRQAQHRRTRAARREAQREAHYMRNFWSYDGSQQEEFEG